MRVLMAVVLLAAVNHAAELQSRNRQKSGSDTKSKSEKRELPEGNNGVEKRLAVLPTSLPSSTPGIVYSDANADKSPVQSIYASPASQIAKISDVLTGHGLHFPAAIASHLYSPVSIYQQRLATPTTYEVSAPVPSQLAYAEKISYQNPVQFTTQVLYNPQQQPQYFHQVEFPRFNAVQVQQAYQPNPRLFTHPQTFQPQQAFVLNQQSYQNPQNAQNTQIIYSQVQQQLSQLAQPVQSQPGIVYARQEKEKDNPKSIQRELNPKPKVEQPAVQENPAQNPNHNTQSQNQDAVSFARFFQGPPPQQQYIQVPQQPQFTQVQPNLPPQQPQFTQVQPNLPPQQPQLTQVQPNLVQVQPQFLIQVPQYQPSQQAQDQNHNQNQDQIRSQLQYQPQQINPIQPQFQIQIPHYQPQAQIRYEPQFNSNSKLESALPNSIPVPLKPAQPRQVVYFRQPQYQPQAYQGVQPQVYQGASNVNVQPASVVQYYGKFAKEIFGGLKQNQ